MTTDQVKAAGLRSAVGLAAGLRSAVGSAAGWAEWRGKAVAAATAAMTGCLHRRRGVQERSSTGRAESRGVARDAPRTVLDAKLRSDQNDAARRHRPALQAQRRQNLVLERYGALREALEADEGESVFQPVRRSRFRPRLPENDRRDPPGSRATVLAIEALVDAAEENVVWL